MISLGIESTAHTLGIGIVDENCRVLANEMSMISNSMGIHPREAANHHAQVFPEMLKSALKKADLSMKDMDLIAFSQGPGLGPCLKTGATGARALALYHSIPLIKRSTKIEVHILLRNRLSTREFSKTNISYI